MARAKAPTIELSEEEVQRILETRKRLREEQKELTKTLQKAKAYEKDDSKHTLAIRIPLDWANALKEYASANDTKVARLHVRAVRDFLEKVVGFDCSESEDDSED